MVNTYSYEGALEQMGWARVYPDGSFDVMHDKPRPSDCGDTVTWEVVPLYRIPPATLRSPAE